MNPEKYFLGFPTSTHASSLGYKKVEAANLQQSADQHSQQRKGRLEKVAKAAVQRSSVETENDKVFAMKAFIFGALGFLGITIAVVGVM